MDTHPPADSAENIYNLLCAVQAQAAADEEEIKGLRLRIVSCENETQRVCEATDALTLDYNAAREETAAEEVNLQEQRARYAGAVEVLRDAQRHFVEAVDAVLLHELQPCTQLEAKFQMASPGTLCGAIQSLRGKINTTLAECRQRREKTERSTAAEVSAETQSGPFSVRYRCEDNAAGSAAENKEAAAAFSNVDCAALVPTRRRKVVTFSAAHLEVRVALQQTARPPAESGVEGQPVAAVSLPSWAIGERPRAARRTLWKSQKDT